MCCAASSTASRFSSGLVVVTSQDDHPVCVAQQHCLCGFTLISYAFLQQPLLYHDGVRLFQANSVLLLRGCV
jgi:hypothetical protein